MTSDEIRVSRSELVAVLERAGLTLDQAAQVVDEVEGRRPVPGVKTSRGAVVMYYLGGLLVVGAMSVFLGESWSAGGDTLGLVVLLAYAGIFGALAVTFDRRSLPIPSGLMATAVVALIPAIVFAATEATGFGKGTEYGDYGEFYDYVSSQWFLMEVATIAVGVVVFRLSHFTLVLAVLGVAMYFAAMDFTEVLFSNEPTAQQRAGVAMLVGMVGIAIGILFDRRRQREHAFWPHLFGAASILWGFEFLAFDASETIGVLASEVLGAAFLVLGTLLARTVYLTLGGILIFGSTCWFAGHLFGDSLFTPLVIALIGLAILFGGVKVQRNGLAFQRWVRGRLPAWLVDVVPITAEDEARFLGKHAAPR